MSDELIAEQGEITMPFIRTKDITQGYWIANNGSIYSASRNALVHANDAGYLAFVAANGAAPPWPTDINGKQTSASLAAVLSFYGLIPDAALAVNQRSTASQGAFLWGAMTRRTNRRDH